jgi:hypothetical protein
MLAIQQRLSVSQSAVLISDIHGASIRWPFADIVGDAMGIGLLNSVLRAAGHVTVPGAINLASFYAVGIPVGALLAFGVRASCPPPLPFPPQLVSECSFSDNVAACHEKLRRPNGAGQGCRSGSWACVLCGWAWTSAWRAGNFHVIRRLF